MQAEAAKVQAVAAMANLVISEALAAKVQAESQLAEYRARSQAMQVQAESQLAESRARSQAMAVRAFAILAPIVGIAVLAVVIVTDFYRHESPTHIKRRMMRTLRASRPPLSVGATASTWPHFPQTPLALGFYPTLLLGPTDSGKSTLLVNIARMAVSYPVPAPTVLVRMRAPSSQRRHGRADARFVTEGKTLIDATAAQIFAQIGYPLRRSVVHCIHSRRDMLRRGHTQKVLANHESRDRLVEALNMLFEVCEQLQVQRVSQGMTPFDAAPVVLFDEVNGFIKDKMLKNAGGDLAFATLLSLLVKYAVDRRAVRVAVTGSSADAYSSFSDTPLASRLRFCYFDVKDPSVDDMIGALRERGYTLDEARDMVALCGTRLRLFDKPLFSGCCVSEHPNVSRGIDFACNCGLR